MNGTKEHEDGDEGRNGGPTVTVVAVTEDRRSQEIELLKQMRLKIAKLDPLSEVSTHARTHASVQRLNIAIRRDAYREGFRDFYREVDGLQ